MSEDGSETAAKGASSVHRRTPVSGVVTLLLGVAAAAVLVGDCWCRAFLLVTCNGTGYNSRVITGFKNRGLKRFFLTGVKSGIRPAHAKRLRLILGRLHASTGSQDMDLPGLHLHELRGRRRGTWSVRVSGNWQVTFKFDGPDAVDVDYEDYH